MVLPPGLRHIIAETRLFTDAQRYLILRLPVHQCADVARFVGKLEAPYVAMVRDKDEVTLVVSEEVWETQGPALDVMEISPPYRLITFDLPLELELVGYLAALSAVLAEVGVSIFTISSFSRDSILVHTDDFERAWEALRSLIRSAQAEEITDAP